MPLYKFNFELVTGAMKFDEVDVVVGSAKLRDIGMGQAECYERCADATQAALIGEAIQKGIYLGFNCSKPGFAIAVAEYHRLKTLELMVKTNGDLKGQISALPLDLDLGAVAYEGFCSASDGKSPITGNPLPKWSATSTDFQNGCRCAAIAILNAVCPAEAT